MYCQLYLHLSTGYAYVLAAESLARILSNDLGQNRTHPSYRT